MLAAFFLSLVSLTHALSSVPLLGYSTIRIPTWESIDTSDQNEVLHAILHHDRICDLDAIILVTQQDLHATHVRSTYRELLGRTQTRGSSVHLPYLTYSESPAENAKEIALRCDSRLVFASPDDTDLNFDPEEKHVIFLQYPPVEEVNSDTLTSQLSRLEEMFASYAVLFTGSQSITKRQSSLSPSESIPVPSPTPSAPLPAKSYRFLTPTLIYTLGLVFGFIIPLFYVTLTALGSIKSPVSSVTYKGPSVEKKNQ
ncbi:hypothetical protein FRC19_003692 [Serendipita sp. 401]|nr:hypothetical protein FRC19_003692 [Serendipita sp. 401]KAG8833392.1 hypothetical protein FRC18_003694 [Serendipita sp. 400]